MLEKALEEKIESGSTPTPADGGFTTGAVAHESSEGFPLVGGGTEETVRAGALCDAAARVREYRIAAVNIEISLNRFLDYDPDGYMYVLEEELERARAEEAQNREARADRAEPAVTVGLQGDAIQPLTIRVNQGECVRIVLRNALDDAEPASLHVHGSAMYVKEAGEPAISTNPDATVLQGRSVTYEWMVQADDQEGVHYFHSHGVDRFQTGHGLFGSLVVEPAGSEYIDPISDGQLRSGWSAVVRGPDGQEFREFAIYYHEIGNEQYRHRDKDGILVEFLDKFTRAYKPGGRAINYRSEPFMNRLQLQRDRSQRLDRSQAYSSYTFGDPSTPIARSYLGDPVKTRLVHGGSEVFHVHHTHGGAIRWRRQSEVGDTAFDTGLDKHPPLQTDGSTRLDSQAVGPSESYDLESECGSGGCQQSVGDFLIHCHVAHHYVAGMWMTWRVYNTLQVGGPTGDGLPSLVELARRAGLMKTSVTSELLIGTTVSWQDQTFDISDDNLSDWVERQLPPRGVPSGYDASVMDWSRDGSRYMNEPETDQEWPAYRSAAPGQRIPIGFDPVTGKLAYPLLRPHLGKRPPFAPGHGPAPFLSPSYGGTGPPLPGENGLGSVCPAGTTLREFAVHAINLPITLNGDIPIIDPSGQLFVLKEEEDAVRASNDLKTPLAIRANAGEDCVDVVLTSELEDSAENGFFSKVNIHIHFVQFDVQASDGVISGFAYEQSIRPFTEEGETLTEAAAAGESGVALSSAQRFHTGILVGVGMDQDTTFKVRRIESIVGDRLEFEQPLEYAHAAGEIVSVEFVRYRWYPDVQFGTAYFHDHVDALTSWQHGLFGALIAEPPGSTYHDPFTGEERRSGPIVDVHTDQVVSPDLTGSFRELVVFIQDNVRLTQQGNSSGGAFSMRVEPIRARPGDPSQWFSSRVHGDPDTPLLNAYLGDPVVVRALVSATNDTHTWILNGHWFRAERFSPDSTPISAVHIGISERYDLIIPAAGGPQQMPGDYLFYNGRLFKLEEGSWGIFRVHGPESESALLHLPGRETTPDPPASVCPAGAPVRSFDVVAMEAALPMLAQTPGRIYALAAQRDSILSGALTPGPLVLHVNVGDCMSVRLTNELSEGRASFHADMLAYDPSDSLGIDAGFNPEQTVAPGETRTYTFFAHPEYGETAALVRDWGNVLQNPGLGLYGAIIVGPEGATYTDPATGDDLAQASSWAADVHPADGPGYRDFALFFQDEDEVIGTAIMPYSVAVDGIVGLNYEAEPLETRLETDADVARVYDVAGHGEPSTPVLRAFAGDAVRIHVMVPHGEQNHVFTIEGHQWPLEPAMAGSDLVSSVQVGPVETLNIILDGGAGGRFQVHGEYVYGDRRMPYREAGLWGILRVLVPGDPGADIRPLAGGS